MIPRPPISLNQSTARANQGFALVIALSLMAFVLLLLLSITTLVQVESQGAQTVKQRMEAEQAALLSLNIAIGKLQEVAGPDQRVTATASIFGDSNNDHVSENPDGSSTTAASVNPANGNEGQGAWVGVWKSDTVAVGTPSYSPAIPDQRKFLGWLVSSANDITGQLEFPQKMSEVGTDISLSPNFVELATDSNGDAYVQVEKVPVADSDTSFAFSIEDESLKADLSWNEHSPSSLSSERYQASRLAAAPGPDYGALNGVANNGPFGAVDYPLTVDGNDLITDSILKIQAAADTTISMSVAQDASDWLKDNRGNITWGSRGVLADVKFGGLRRDLSLAFEMDGDADVSVSDQPTKFNLQVGEFVGNNDRLSSPVGLKPTGMPVEERFLFRDVQNSGTPFSGDIGDGTQVLRGPNWWALRDYANLYKRLSGTGGDYTMEARPYYPNKSSETIAFSERFDIINEADTWDRETNVQQQGGRTPKGTEHYLYRPAAANYVPVNLGTSIIVSMMATNVAGAFPNQTADLAVGLDPLFYFWNPYNRKIECEHIAVRLDRGFPGTVKLWVNGLEHSTIGISDMLEANVTNRSGMKITFLIKNPSGGPIVLEPGEVVIASPTTAGTGEAIFGYATDNTSGIIMTKLNGNIPINVNINDSIGFKFIKGGGNNSAVRHDMDTSIPDDSATAVTITANFDASGEETQSIHIPMWAGARGMAEYVSPEALDDKNPVTTTTVSALTSGKAYFGAHAVLIKPASSGAENAGPVEMFSRFNPAPMLMKRDYYADCMPNQIYRHVTANGWNTILDEVGIDLGGSQRGTYWGLSYQGTGSETVPISNIPSSPLISLAEFADANLSVMGTDPYRAVGNSWSSPLITPTSAYGPVKGLPGSWPKLTAQDYSWLINDALFDRYYLSGLAADFSIGSSGYSASGTLEDTISLFTSGNYSQAQASPVLRPYLPGDESVSDIVASLSADDGYKKMGAYSLIDGAFNVNSTSVSAWAAFLRANRNLDVDYAGGGDDSTDGVPFPSSPSPSEPGNGAQPEWSGFSRLTDPQITGLAERIVEQVKLRGPFMSLSDFVNHRMGTLDSDVSYTGALQAALDLEAASGGSGINADSRTAAENSGAIDGNAALGTPDYPTRYYDNTLVIDEQKTTTGIPGDITQADLLLPLAPRITARSDTFRVRAYGEVSTLAGGATTAVCEAVIQRLPQYVDTTDVAWKDPWDQVTDPAVASVSTLSAINQQFGRRFKVVQFRWLNADEI